MLRGGQVICGPNATRIQLTIAMKRAAGFDTVYPTGERRNGHGATDHPCRDSLGLRLVNRGEMRRQWPAGPPPLTGENRKVTGTMAKHRIALAANRSR
jgi:hypothetical protein